MSVIRTIVFFNNNRLFTDPKWETVDLITYTIAEPGTYFLAACSSSYRIFGKYLRHEKIRSIFARIKMKEGHSRQSFIRVKDSRENGEKESKNSDKRVRGYNSIMLSEIERESYN